MEEETRWSSLDEATTRCTHQRRGATPQRGEGPTVELRYRLDHVFGQRHLEHLVICFHGSLGWRLVPFDQAKLPHEVLDRAQLHVRTTTRLSGDAQAPTRLEVHGREPTAASRGLEERVRS